MHSSICSGISTHSSPVFGVSLFESLQTVLQYGTILLVAILITFSLYILRRENYSLSSLLFLSLSLLFLLWVLLTATELFPVVIKIAFFAEQIAQLIEPLIFIVAACLTYTVIHKRAVPASGLFLSITSLLPVLILLPSVHNVAYFDLLQCQAGHGILRYYIYAIEIVAVFMIGGMLFTALVLKERETLLQRKITLFVVGLLILTSWFFVAIFAADQLYDLKKELYSSFILAVVAVLLLYIIAEFKNLYSKILATEIFVGILSSFIFGILFIRTIDSVRAATVLIFIFTVLLGALIVRGTRKESEQRKEIEKLAKKLQNANKRLRLLDRQKTEFVSIASHQLRSPLTSIRGYASMLLEGSYGKIPKKAEEAIHRIQESSRFMALSVEDYLNVSRIEQGNMKYEMSVFDLKLMTEQIVDEFRHQAIKKGLVMMFRSDCDEDMFVRADVGKLRQIIYNLIDNALKYTEKGTITVIAHDVPKRNKVCVTVHDTGVGISKVTMSTLFEKFVRAKNANNVNVTGTGLGLYVAKIMLEAMKGKLLVSSEGEGEGSAFVIELPRAK